MKNKTFDYFLKLENDIKKKNLKEMSFLFN